MGGFASIVRGALAGANGAAGNTQTAQSLEAANQRQRDAQQAQLRAKVLPHALAIRGLQEQLKATTDPTERAALTHDLTRNLEEISDVLYPDRNPKGNFFERGITDKLHLTSLKNRQDKLKALQDMRKKQAEEGGKAIAQGAPPFTQTPGYQEQLQKEQAAQALKSQEEQATAAREAAKEASAEKIQEGKEAVQEKIQEQKEQDMLRREQEQQERFEKTQENLDRRADQRLAAQERLTELRDQLHQRQQELAATSKIPSAVAGRVTQAQIIKEQTATLRQMLKDPDIQKYMGPIAGRTTGRLASLYSKKVRDFYAAQESLDALLPLLHGYRGGTQTHETFKNAMGSLTIDPKAYEGTLDALDKLSDNVVDEVRDEYPNAPMFKGRSSQSQPRSQAGVVSIADAMKKYPGASREEVKQAIIDQGLTPVD